MSIASSNSSRRTRKKPVVADIEAVQGNKLEAYKVPLSIYEKALNEIKSKPEAHTENIRRRCHQTTYKNFNNNAAPLCRANVMEAAKQALEDRNYKELYELMKQALKVRDLFLMQQMHEYMYIAINHDPCIVEDRGEVLIDYVTRVKRLKDGQEDFLEQAHVFTSSFMRKRIKIEEDPDYVEDHLDQGSE